MEDGVPPPPAEEGPPSPDEEKPRWSLSEEGRMKMEEVYAMNKFPPTAVRERLAREVGGTMRQIQVWFQNRRGKQNQQRCICLTRERPLAPPYAWVEACAPGRDAPEMLEMAISGASSGRAQPRMAISPSSSATPASAVPCWG